MITIRDLMLAAKLKSYRAKLQIKQLDAAFRLGYNGQQEYSEMENGRRHFSDDIVRKICQTFAIDEAEFLRADPAVLVQIITASGLPLKVVNEDPSLREKQHLLHVLECERRITELKLLNAKKDRELLLMRANNLRQRAVPTVFHLI